MWIKREISKILSSDLSAIQVLQGPRQVGKTSLFLNLDGDFKELSLDDPKLRELAQNDPELLLRQFQGQKLFIDEVQYAPNLFPSLKRMVDLYKRQASALKTIVRLTGSNQILLDKQVKESLSGRASYFDLNTLSISELLSHDSNLPIQSLLFKGGWPELYSYPDLDPVKHLNNYIATYIEKDIVLSAGVQKSQSFLKFVQLLASRVGQTLEKSKFASELQVSQSAISDWISILEKMHIIRLLPAYQSNLSKRLIKSPKIYFLDTGLVCRLQGWSEPLPLMTSPQQGFIFENLVFSELYKMKINSNLDFDLYHFRTKDKFEVDFLIHRNNQESLFIESKLTPQKAPDLKSVAELKKVFSNKIPQFFMCHMEGDHVLDYKVPIRHLRETFVKRLS